MAYNTSLKKLALSQSVVRKNTTAGKQTELNVN